jgi:hypothetical protein
LAPVGRMRPLTGDRRRPFNAPAMMRMRLFLGSSQLSAFSFQRSAF